jgi:hypothetical protein
MQGTRPNAERALAAFVIGAGLLGAGAGAVARAGSPLEYDDGRVSARLAAVPLADVLDMFARESGATVSGDIAAPRTVTKRFDDVPVAEALDRLLGRQNFTLSFSRDGRLRRVELHGLANPPTPRRVPARRRAVTRTPASTMPARGGR